MVIVPEHVNSDLTEHNEHKIKTNPKKDAQKKRAGAEIFTESRGLIQSIVNEVPEN